MPYYAEAFSVTPGQCFRFTHSGVGHASHCREPVICRGRFEDRAGKWHWVEACAEHGAGLVDD